LIVSSAQYQSAKNKLMLAYVSSQISRATLPFDHTISDWQAAGLLRPSFVRAKIATIKPHLIKHRVGKLSHKDLAAVDKCLYSALGLGNSSAKATTKTNA